MHSTVVLDRGVGPEAGAGERRLVRGGGERPNGIDERAVQAREGLILDDDRDGHVLAAPEHLVVTRDGRQGLLGGCRRRDRIRDIGGRGIREERGSTVMWSG